MTKLHKNPIPIVSGIGGITERISSFLDHFLQPVLITIPSYLKNSSELIELIKDTHIHTNDILVTVDVSSLYLNIPQEEGTQAVVNLLEERGALPLPKDVITHMLNIVLKYNIFKFGDSVYRQVKGTAMGTKCAPAFAGIFMNTLESNFLATTPIKPAIFKRYIDDIFILWKHGEPELSTFLNTLNEAHPSINFTWDYSTSQVTFLDLDIYKHTDHENGTTSLKYRTHFKPTNSFQYVHYKSFHPRATKKGILKGELTRIHRTTAEESIRQDTLELIKGKFHQRGYPEALTSNTSPQTSERPRRQLPPILKVANVQGSSVLPKLIRDTWDETVANTSLKALFADPPMVVFRRSRNLANYICRASTPGTVAPGPLTFQLSPIQPSKRVHPCGHPLCKCCAQLFDAHNLNGIPLVHHLNCKSKNIVYLLKCKDHPRCIYVGQTTRQLNQRLANHRGTLHNPGHKRSWPLYSHYLTGNHNADHMLVCPLEAARKEDLLTREHFWIKTLNSARRPGLNFST